jgi:4-alpha-glucanotransferase
VRVGSAIVTRHAGVILPLFSAASTSSWGIGEIADLAPLSEWLAAAGFDRLMLLPLGTLPPGETSPYSARSAMAIDPIYIAVERVDDFERSGGLAAASPETRAGVERARRSPRVDYTAVREAKAAALDQAFAWFYAREWSALTTRAARLAGFIARERWWLYDYALWQALSADQGGRPWMEWPSPLRDRDPSALGDARRRLAPEVLRHQYWQWLADVQWRAAREHAHAHGVSIVGDLPFVVAADGPEIWTHAREVDLDVSLGVPPDAFSETGQDWRLPTYKWDAIAATDFAWLRARARRTAALFDAVRLDHLVGFFRTFGRSPEHGEGFRPPDEPSQRAQGERVLRLFLEQGVDVIGEDLGVIPEFVRAIMAALGVPGCKVLRWERAWHEEGAPFLEPASFAPRSAALTGTHDTTPLAVWWDDASIEERAAWLRLAGMASRGCHDPAQPWNNDLRDAILATAYDAASADLFIPFGDLFGWRDRINTPAIVDAVNWTWKLPWAVDGLSRLEESTARARWCAGEAARCARG